jgi:catechol-2,3-dioxygenase/quercetin dioxygenase-like cupin family protein
MTQQTIDLHINPSDGTISEDLKQTIERAGDTDQPGIFLLNEAAWNPPKEASRGCRNTGIHHVGLRATNPAVSAEFYRDVLGMQIVGGSAPDHPIGATAFLSSRPDEESHEIALFANPAFAHVAFKVSSLAELRSLHARVVERNIPIKFLANHGVSFAFYFDDPDGNTIEVYWPTGELSRSLQPQMEPLDLSQPDEALIEKITAKHAQAGAAAGGANGTAPELQRNEFKYGKESIMTTQVAVNTRVEESIAFARGRRSLDRSVWYNGSLMTFLATAEDTQGQFALIEAVARKGNVPPPHIHHREEETFYVLEGEMTVSVGDRTIKATRGTMVFLPCGVAHSFTIESEQLRMLILLTPAGMEGWFKEFSVAAPAMTLPPAPEVPYSEIQRMLEVGPQYGIEFVLPRSRKGNSP